MATLKAAQRKKLPATTFGLPQQRKYPMPDKAHAANAKARATQQVERGNLTPATKVKIDAKANRVLGKSAGAATAKRKARAKPVRKPARRSAK